MPRPSRHPIRLRTNVSPHTHRAVLAAVPEGETVAEFLRRIIEDRMAWIAMRDTLDTGWFGKDAESP